MLDFEVVAQFLHHLVVQIIPVICNYPASDVVPAYDVLFDEVCNQLTCYVDVGRCFYPLGKVVDGYQYKSGVCWMLSA